MYQPFAHKNLINTTSRRQRTAHTVLLRMAADQERADRIRALKKEHLEYTWQAIADHVGVSLRAAQAWQEKGGIDYEHARRLAELWVEDLDYIMRGPRDETPDLSNRELAGLQHLEGRVERVEDTLEDVREEFRGLVQGVNVKLDTLLRIAGHQTADENLQAEIQGLIDHVGPPEPERAEPPTDAEDEDEQDLTG